jgi:hypothetical protein
MAASPSSEMEPWPEPERAAALEECLSVRAAEATKANATMTVEIENFILEMVGERK